MPRRLLLLPPLAFARIGVSRGPVDWFLWGPNDTSIQGTGKTTVFRCSHLDKKGMPVQDRSGEPIVFRDEHGIRPVSPYFELFETVDAGTVEPVTPERIEPRHVVWTFQLGNLKAFYRTGAEGDKVLGDLTVRADKPGKKTVFGKSPRDRKPLVFARKPIDMGTVEVLKPERNKPYRIRFWPPKGLVYGPSDIDASKLGLVNNRKAESQKILATLNPAAAWPNWKLPDPRNFLGKLSMFTKDTRSRSVGLMDDTSDGFVNCRLSDRRSARSRIAITPPYYAPDRRHLISCADGLKDREDRDETLEETEAEGLVLDILERVLETAGMMNLEALVQRYEDRENPNYAHSSDQPWFKGASEGFDVEKLQQQTLETFPLTEMARRKHRQFMSLDLLKRFIRQRPTLLQEILRPPAGNNQFYNRQMPALQRGSDARPLHLTRRQYEMLLKWSESVGRQ